MNRKALLTAGLIILLGATIYGSGYVAGKKHSERNWMLKFEQQQKSYAEAEIIRQLSYNASLQAALKLQQMQQARADKVTLELATAQNKLKTVTNKLQKEVIYVTQKDKSSGDTCPAFNVDGLRLYTKALGYPSGTSDRDTTPETASATAD